MTAPTTPTPRTHPRKRGGRHTIRRLGHAALFAVVRGLAYALGTAAGGALISLALWWITHH